MSPEFNMQITQVLAKRYSKASKKDKSSFLKEYCLVANVSMNLAAKRIRLVARTIFPDALKPCTALCNRRGPKPKYLSKHVDLLKLTWNTLGCICAERLHPILPSAISQLNKLHALDSFDTSVISLCKSVSLGKLKNIIASFPKPLGYRKHSRKPGIHSRVPIESNFNRYSSKPGYLEVDPVEHTGGNSSGPYAITGCYVDIFSQWIARSAALGMNLLAIEAIHNSNSAKFLHPIIKYHSDNAKAVLTILFKKAYGGDPSCDQAKLSRSRPYKKEDNGHVEQKNGDKIRKLVGYHRYDTKEQVDLLNAFYDTEDKISNHFIPSQKLIKKNFDSSGKLLKKYYDKAKTPYHRLLKSKSIDKHVKKELKRIHRSLNLVSLRNEAERLKSDLFKSISRN